MKNMYSYNKTNNMALFHNITYPNNGGVLVFSSLNPIICRFSDHQTSLKRGARYRWPSALILQTPEGDLYRKVVTPQMRPGHPDLRPIR